MTKDEAFKLALEVLEEGVQGTRPLGVATLEAIATIKEALAQPEPWEKFCDSNCVWTDHHPDCKLAEKEPVVAGWLRIVQGHTGFVAAETEWGAEKPEKAGMWIPLYTTPPQRTWVGLTDEDEIPWDGVDAKSFARAIEAKLKEKNT